MGQLTRAERISRLIRPRSIVVYGASAKRSASGNEAIGNLIASGYPAERIHLIHRSATTIDGMTAVSSLDQLPEIPDLALISLPGAALADTIESLDGAGVPAAIIPTSGLTPDDRIALQDVLSRTSIAVHGNNCMGVINVSDSIPLWFYEGLMVDLPTGPISLVSQSGSATFVAKAVQGAGFARIVSTGNEIDLGLADYLEWLADDEATKTVGIVVESITDGVAFEHAVKRLRESSKPLVALKVGRTAAGQRAAAAHTGAMVTNHDAVTAFFRRLDVPLVNDYDELAVTLGVLAHPGFVPPAGPRIAVISDSGGESGLAADLATERGIVLPEFESETLAALSALAPGEEINNPFDAGASPLTTGEGYVRAYRTAAEDPGIDAVLVILEGHGSFGEDEIRYGVEMLSDAIRAAAAQKPLVLASSSSSNVHPLVGELFDGRIPVARGILNGLVALTAAAGNRGEIGPVAQRPAEIPNAERLATLRAAVGQDPSHVSPRLAAELLNAYKVPFVQTLVTGDLQEAIAWAAGRYPVVAKVASEHVPHRSDVGGVVLGIQSADELRTALSKIRGAVQSALPEVVVDRFEIQEQIENAHEGMIGTTADPQLGVTAIVGSGGVLVELLADTAAHSAPLSENEAAALIESTKFEKLLRGYRNLYSPSDTAELRNVLVRTSWLAADFSDLIDEIDLNPVLVETGTGRTRVVDALLVRRTFQQTAESEIR